MATTQNRVLADFAKDVDSAAVGSFFVTGSDADKTIARPIVQNDVTGFSGTVYDSASTIALVDSAFIRNKVGYASFSRTNVRSTFDSADFDLVPKTKKSKSLGSSSLKWKNVFVNKLSFGGSFIDENGVDGGDAKGITVPTDRTVADITVPTAGATASLYATFYANLTSGNITTVSYTSGTQSINSVVDAATNGDVILLSPGTYQLTSENVDNYARDVFRNKDIAIVGKTLDPADVKLTIPVNTGARDDNLFDGGRNANYYHHFANLHLVRASDAAADDNYAQALSRGTASGYVRNCIVDLNNNPVTWLYDNTNASTPIVSFTNCSFVNWSTWNSNYSGGQASLVVTDCGFDDVRGTQATFSGTNTNSVSYTANTYAYSDNGSTYGHLKGISTLASSDVKITAP